MGKREKEPPAADSPEGVELNDFSSGDATPSAEAVADLNSAHARPLSPARKPRKTKPKEYGPTLAAPPPGFRYVVRGGVTVAVPLTADDAEDAPDDTTDDTGDDADDADALSGGGRVYDAPAVLNGASPTDHLIDPEIEPERKGEAREPHGATAYAAPARGGGDFADGFAEGEIVALWRRLPRHIQLLVGLAEPQHGEEIAQKYYTRGFKESRQQLIERLLDPTLTLEETARVLGVVPTTVRRYTNRGVLPCYRTIGQQRRFRLSDVLAFLEQEQKRQARKAARLAEKMAVHQVHQAAIATNADVTVSPQEKVVAAYRNGAA